MCCCDCDCVVTVGNIWWRRQNNGMIRSEVRIQGWYSEKKLLKQHNSKFFFLVLSISVLQQQKLGTKMAHQVPLWKFWAHIYRPNFPQVPFLYSVCHFLRVFSSFLNSVEYLNKAMMGMLLSKMIIYFGWGICSTKPFLVKAFNRIWQLMLDWMETRKRNQTDLILYAIKKTVKKVAQKDVFWIMLFYRNK